MRILTARGYSVQPWKNGGGVTMEIIVSPAGAGFDDFDWRISMAKVAGDGAFSMFPGIDRSLGLLEGAGLVLRVAARGEIALQLGAHPAVFPGDVPIDAQLPGGAILDLNVMSRRGKWRHQLSRVAAAAGPFDLQRRGNVTVAVMRGMGGEAAGKQFGGDDAILLTSEDADDTVLLQLIGSAEIWIADLWRLEIS